MFLDNVSLITSNYSIGLTGLPLLQYQNITAESKENIKMFYSQYEKICRLTTNTIHYNSAFLSCLKIFIPLYIICSLNF